MKSLRYKATSENFSWSRHPNEKQPQNLLTTAACYTTSESKYIQYHNRQEYLSQAVKALHSLTSLTILY